MSPLTRLPSLRSDDRAAQCLCCHPSLGFSLWSLPSALPPARLLRHHGAWGLLLKLSEPYLCLCSHTEVQIEKVAVPHTWLGETWHIFTSVQFSSVQSFSGVRLCDPMNHSTPGLPVHHHLPEFTQTHIHQVCDAIQPSHPQSSPSPPAPNPSQHQSLFP